MTKRIPLSLHFVFNRIFEKVMHKGLKSSLDVHDVIYQNQSDGFREKRSARANPCLNIIKRSCINMDKKNTFLWYIYRLKNAFDILVVDPSIFYCTSWNIMILEGSVNKCFFSHISGQIQAIQVVSKTAKPRQILVLSCCVTVLSKPCLLLRISVRIYI